MADDNRLRIDWDAIRRMEADIRSARFFFGTVEETQFAKTARELHNSPFMRMVRDIQNSPMVKAMQELANSPEIKAIQEMMRSPEFKGVQDLANSSIAKEVRDAARSVDEIRDELFSVPPLGFHAPPSVDFAALLRSKDARLEGMVRRVVREELERLGSNEGAAEEPLYGSDGEKRTPGFDIERS